MQLLLDKLQIISSWQVGYLIGVILLTGLLLHLFLHLYGYARRLGFEKQQQDLAKQEMQISIKAAMLRCQEAEAARQVWNGFRKFRVAKKVLECQDVYSYYLAPHDGKPIQGFKPGQYLTFQIYVPHQPKPVIRCYSISDAPRSDNHFRVTIKKALAPKGASVPHGIASTYFSDYLKEGDILDVKAPGGAFFLDLARATPVVLISGGVGITPMLSMMNAILNMGSKRQIWFFHGARNSKEHIQKDYLEQVVKEHENVHLFVSYSNPLPTDVMDKDYNHKGYVTVSLLKDVLPSNNFEFFICGPPSMMDNCAVRLAEWGVPKNRINFEAFGPPPKKKSEPTAAVKSGGPEIKINFSRSGKTLVWDTGCETILDFAEQKGIEISSGCRSGSCGTCLVAVKSGKVSTGGAHDAPGEEGSCLTCICKPETDLVLDI
ncbi:MAG: hypothetical protein JWN25_1966 [Verrucomicrobiales bacterium]|nr:hypothetical protein [Verrucomicrobiales bacterium]